MCVFVGVPLSCAGQRGQGQEAIDSLSCPKQTRNCSQFEHKIIIVKKIQMRTANEMREYKPPEFYPVTSLKTIRIGIMDFLFSTVIQNKFMKRQCCGSGSGIRCLYDPWLRDQGSGIGFFRILDPGSRIPDAKPIFLRAW